MKAFDNDGRELDALYTIEPTPTGALLTVESRGGGRGGPRPPRNEDYASALALLLSRLGEEGATLTDVEVYSRDTRDLPIADRRIFAPSFPLPYSLATLTQPDRLRLELGRAAAALGRAPGRTGGNPTKRLRLTLAWPGAVGRTAGELEDRLARRPSMLGANGGRLRYDRLGAFLKAQTADEVRLRLSEIAGMIGHALPRDAWTPQFWANAADHHQTRRRQWLGAGFGAFFERRTETVLFRRMPQEQPTADPDELRRRVARAKKRREGLDSDAPPPNGVDEPQKLTGQVARYSRDPEVIAWVLSKAGGHCEVCDAPAPFDNVDGEPFLEVHHIRPLSEGGPDKIHNAVAACPNCHRRLHYGRDRDQVRMATVAKVKRLVDHPIRL